jgi:hypothetical protein
MLHSDNTIYLPYEIKASEILEIWEYACSIATNEFTPDDLSAESLKDMFRIAKRREIRKWGIKLIQTNLCAITRLQSLETGKT